MGINQQKFIETDLLKNLIIAAVDMLKLIIKRSLTLPGPHSLMKDWHEMVRALLR